MKLNLTNSVVIVFVTLAVIGAGAKFYQNSKPGPLDEFAQCLTDNGAIMYGAYWCSNCQIQRQMFGKSFDNINYVECEDEKALCESEGIKGYPTWKKDKDGTVTVVGTGVQPLVKLAQDFACTLPATE